MADDARATPARGSTPVPSSTPPDVVRLEFEVSSDRAAPGTARRTIRQWLAEHAVGVDMARDVSLVVSELVTNSVLHAVAPTRVVALLGPQQLRLEFHDGSGEPPAPRRPSDEVAGGYGLRIVDELTTAWGWSSTSTGKFVWTVHDREVPAPLA